MILPVNLGSQSYEIVIERGALKRLGSYLNLNRKVLILTDSGVPEKYAREALSFARDGYIYTVEQGEKSKCFDNYKKILEFMAEKAFTRTDCVVCVGGGVVGDLGGFVAASYMRGIDFYNVPTTLLSQVDSSIGGKVAIDLNGIKNIVGAFYQPKKVVVDIDTLKTLDERQLHAGLCEAIKMAACADIALFNLIKESRNLFDDIEKIVTGALKIKRDVVEKDPCEKNLRKVLNFGHTIGHAIESDENLGGLLHGECVSLGMLPMCSPEVRGELTEVLKKYNLPTEIVTNSERLISYIKRDKKAKGDMITVIFVERLGTFEMRDIEILQIKKYIDGGI